MALQCVCLSETSWCSIETAKRIGRVLAWEIQSTYCTLCYKENRIILKIRLLSSGTLPQTMDLDISLQHIDR